MSPQGPTSPCYCKNVVSSSSSVVREITAEAICVLTPEVLDPAVEGHLLPGMLGPKLSAGVTPQRHTITTTTSSSSSSSTSSSTAHTWETNAPLLLFPQRVLIDWIWVKNLFDTGNQSINQSNKGNQCDIPAVCEDAGRLLSLLLLLLWTVERQHFVMFVVFIRRGPRTEALWWC